MKVLEKYILNPFGSGNSCIDTINGECIRGKTAKECQSICESSPSCHLGMYIKKPHISSYCLPFNTIDYLNRPLSRILVHKENESLLSTNKKVDLQLFYNEKTYPGLSIPRDIILNHNICYLIVMKDDKKYFVTNQLSLSTSRPTDPFVFSIGEHSYIRFMSGMKLFWYNKQRTEILTCDFSSKSFHWKPYTALPQDANQFILTGSKKFVDHNSHINFSLNHDGKVYYLDFSPNLTISTKKPNLSIKWMKAGDPDFDTIEQNTKIMEEYLEQFSTDKSCHNSLYITLIVFFCIFFFIVFLLYKWKYIQLF